MYRANVDKKGHCHHFGNCCLERKGWCTERIGVLHCEDFRCQKKMKYYPRLKPQKIDIILKQRDGEAKCFSTGGFFLFILLIWWIYTCITSPIYIYLQILIMYTTAETTTIQPNSQSTDIQPSDIQPIAFNGQALQTQVSKIAR